MTCALGILVGNATCPLPADTLARWLVDVRLSRCFKSAICIIIAPTWGSRAILGKGRRRENILDTTAEDLSEDASSHPEEVEESYVDWIQRVTHEAEEGMRLAKIPDWADESYRRKWRWYGHVCRRRDGRWTPRVLQWTPDRGRRGQGHPCTRWADVFTAFSARLNERGEHRDLAVIAESRETWAAMEVDFVNSCHESARQESTD